ncbi:hypothetical protein JTE90_007373 [Oedothorax gibbosus]|uniref:Secreted protein n=1 Tax=Oedothorax gibbosus TaxID=931172 RepID=A0AAV6U6K0_9ARAC|nr:hypothetical protein JTE90_007373 [Oedothorax gibbosus]
MALFSGMDTRVVLTSCAILSAPGRVAKWPGLSSSWSATPVDSARVLTRSPDFGSLLAIAMARCVWKGIQPVAPTRVPPQLDPFAGWGLGKSRNKK